MLLLPGISNRDDCAACRRATVNEKMKRRCGNLPARLRVIAAQPIYVLVETKLTALGKSDQPLRAVAQRSELPVRRPAHRLGRLVIGQAVDRSPVADTASVPIGCMEPHRDRPQRCIV